MLSPKLTLESVDPDVWRAVKGEEQRQEEYIELIASENYASPAVMEAQGISPDQQIRRGLSRKALLRRV